MRLLIAMGMLAAPAAWAQTVPETPTIQIVDLGSPDRASLRNVDIVDANFRPPTSDYPAAAIAAHSEAQTMVQINVGADDSIIGCITVRGVALATNETSYRHLETPADPLLAQAACDVIRRHGAFRHGLDRDGGARGGLYQVMVNFLLKDPGNSLYFSPSPPGPQSPIKQHAAPADPAALTFTGASADFPNNRPEVFVGISEKGKASLCRVTRSSGSDRGDLALCRYMLALRYTPARDSHDKKIADPGRRFSLTVMP